MADISVNFEDIKYDTSGSNTNICVGYMDEDELEIEFPKIISDPGGTPPYSCTSLNWSPKYKEEGVDLTQVSDCLIPKDEFFVEDNLKNLVNLKTLVLGSGITSNIENEIELISKYCKNLEYISVRTENNYFKSDDGVLYDFSRQNIYIYPPKSREDGFTSFTVLSDVVDIKPYAFYNNNVIESIGVESGNNYFSIYNNSLYRKLNDESDKLSLYLFPPKIDGVVTFTTEINTEKIIKNAFINSPLTTINITENVIYLGYDDRSNILKAAELFISCDNLNDVNVISTNPEFSSISGCLYNRDKSSLLFTPRGKSPILPNINSMVDIDNFLVLINTIDRNVDSNTYKLVSLLGEKNNYPVSNNELSLEGFDDIQMKHGIVIGKDVSEGGSGFYEQLQ